MAKAIPMSRRRAPQGFSMIEFLVAAFIMAIGLLGLVALSATSLRQTTTGRQRGTATYVANYVLQQAQFEGQASYNAKIASTTLPAGYTLVFTASPGTGIDSTAFGGFNIDGVQVTAADGTAMADVAARVPDVRKRQPVFTASWVRRAYNGGTTPTSTGPQSQEFLANVVWVEGGANQALTISKVIRY